MSGKASRKLRRGARGRPPAWPEEFRKDAVAEVVGGRTIADVARSLGVNEQTLGNWVRKHRERSGEDSVLSADERSELVELRDEVATLRRERDLLKRSLAFWVKESTP